MKRFLTILFAGLLIAAIAAPALAWEFNMKGEYEYRLKYFARTGNSDLFGIATAQDAGLLAGNGGTGTGAGGTGGAWIGFAGPQIWNRGAVPAAAVNTGAGNVITRGGFSRWGSDAHYSDSRLTLYPEIRVNPAIRVHGVYTVGGYRNENDQFTTGVGIPPLERYYMHQVSQNAYDTAGIGSWEQFRATVQMPWGIWSYGVKDFPFGTGATLGNNTRAEAFLTVVPYGPFRILHGIWLSRGLLDGYAEAPDADLKFTWFQGALLTYDNADLSLGVGWFGRTGHFNRGNINPTPLPPGAAVAVPFFGATVPVFGGDALDLNQQFYLGYFKYNNGRFFMNAEYAWCTLDAYLVGRGSGPNFIGYNQTFTNIGATPVAGIPGGLRTPQFAYAQHAFAELGVMAGPSKTTLMWAWSPGRNLNGSAVTTGQQDAFGTATVTWPTGSFNTTNSTIWSINYQAMDPYNTLMFQTYAGGNNIFQGIFVNDGRYGMMGDAWCLAGRLDYAVASNLNVWGTYIWAERLERDGYLAGEYGAIGTFDATAASTLAGAGAGHFRSTGTDPFAGSKFLGWEANVGVDWKLLEGMTMYVKYAYWQPGDWFDWAYQAVASPSTILGGTAAIGKDAIQSIQGSFLINF